MYTYIYGGFKKIYNQPNKEKKKIKIMNNEKPCYGHSGTVE